MKDTKLIEKTPFEIYMEEVAKRREEYREELKARGVTFKEWNFDASHDYGKGPGNWTGD